MRKLITVATALVFLLITSKAYQSQALSFHFVDEEDNIVLGRYLLKQEKLYRDLFSHHQPLAYIFSAGVQKATSPNSLFLLIKRHREAIIIWSVLWSLLLVVKFGPPFLIFILFHELLKFFLLGHLFLSESLAVYPLMYFVASIFTEKEGLSFFKVIFLGFCFALTLLLLSPLWPALLFLLAVLFFYRKLTKENYFWFFLGILPLIIIVFIFISPPDYLHNALYINFKYYIPMTSKEPLVSTLASAFFAPFLTLLFREGRTATLQVTQFLAGIMLFNWAFLLKQKRWRLVSLMFMTLGLVNLRYIAPGQQEYSGFHILPWFATLILITTIGTKMVWVSYAAKRAKVLIAVLLIGAFFVTVRESRGGLFSDRDMKKDYYINYSRQASFAEAVRIMKLPGERLMVMPDEWLIYWQADIDHASKMVNFYAWMANVPELMATLYETFAQNPPAYLYCDRCDRGYFGLEEFFPKYQRLEKDGQVTNLFVLKEKLHDITVEQKVKLSYFNFKIN